MSTTLTADVGAPSDAGRRAAGQGGLPGQAAPASGAGGDHRRRGRRIFFALTSDTFATLSGMARWTDVASTLGIMAVAVALLMIGGEFDLSSGVMTGSAGLLMGILATEVGMNIWLAILLTFVFAACVGFVNGYMVIRTGLPSFIVTLATFFILRGVNLGGTKAITDTVRVGGLRDVSGYDSAQKILASDFWAPHNFRITVIWWIVIAARGDLGAEPHARGQLDLRRRRRQDRGAQRRRPGQPRQDRPVHDDLDVLPRWWAS